jgi:hypothetical protein
VVTEEPEITPDVVLDSLALHGIDRLGLTRDRRFLDARGRGYWRVSWATRPRPTTRPATDPTRPGAGR